MIAAGVDGAAPRSCAYAPVASVPVVPPVLEFRSAVAVGAAAVAAELASALVC